MLRKQSNSSLFWLFSIINLILNNLSYNRYSDLLALAEYYDPKPPTKRKNTKGKGKFSQVSNTNNDSNAESDSSEVSI